MNGSKPEAKGNDLNSLIAKYNAELMSYYQRNASRILPIQEETGDSPAAASPSMGSAGSRSLADRETGAEEAAPPMQEETPAQEEPEAIIAYPTRRIDEPPAREVPPEEPDAPTAPAPQPPLDSAEDGNREQLEEEAHAVPEEEPYEGYPEPQFILPEEERAGDIGYLQITASSGRTAQPVMNAYVTVSRPEPDGSTRLYWLALTDRDGNTPSLPLPTLSRNDSLKPGVPEPYLSYNVKVDAVGYYTVRNLNVPIYGGISANQPVEMIPLPEQTPSGTLTFPETGPQELD